MKLVDWRELYASNQAAIERAGGIRSELPTALLRPSSPQLPRPSASASATLAEPPLRFVVHVPPGADRETAVPLVCMLHGCTQDAAGFAAATRMNEAADRHGFVVVYPEQDRGQNPQGCWNWFLPEHQARGAGEPAAIVAVVRHVMDTTSAATIDRRRVFVAGLSAGGAMAMVLAATYPDLFAAVGVHSGLAYRSAGNVATAFGAMSRGGGGPAELGAAIPSIVIHGTADQTVAPLNADQVLTQAMTANRRGAPQPPTTSRGQVDGGRAYTRARWTDSRGTLTHELLKVEGLGHAWSGGAPGHPHSDPSGPNASEAIWRFFAQATPVSASPAAVPGDPAGSRPHRGELPRATG
jgi:poly(hydroxyalkanoate) depolymerase family esterase